MTMKKKDLKSLVMTMTSIGATKVKTKLAYALVMNKKILEPHVEAIAELEKPPQLWIDYEEARFELCTEYANKDEQGKPKTVRTMEGEVFDINEETKEEFEEKMTSLRSDSKEAFEVKAKHETELIEFLEEEAEIEFFKVDMDHLPDEIAPSEMEVLLPLLKD